MYKEKCEFPAMFRYTWPGRDEAVVCFIHARKLDALARVMGFYLQFIQLTPDEMMQMECSSEKIKDKTAEE